MMGDEPSPREMGYYVALGQTGVEMVLPAVGGFYLDQWLGTTPWITILAAVLGFAGGLVHLIVILRQKERDEQTDQKPPT
jgi:F0F1-type ATP synthase assembly protein I